jgi:transposase
MAMGRREREDQRSFWIAAPELPKTAAHSFYERTNQILDSHGFDGFVEGLCRKFYADKLGRPSLPPAIYFRLLLIGYFEGIDSEGGIAWRLADSLGLRKFLGYQLTDETPDHSTLSRNRRLIDVETHRQVFTWVLGALADAGLLKGKMVGIDATTLEANAAMRALWARTPARAIKSS